MCQLYDPWAATQTHKLIPAQGPLNLPLLLPGLPPPCDLHPHLIQVPTQMLPASLERHFLITFQNAMLLSYCLLPLSPSSTVGSVRAGTVPLQKDRP